MFTLLKEIRVVRSTVQTELTDIGEVFEEYCDKAGYFYSRLMTPTGVGLPFDVDDTRNWIAKGKMEVIESIPAEKSIWHPILCERMEKELETILEERKRLDYLVLLNQDRINFINNYKLSKDPNSALL